MSRQLPSILLGDSLPPRLRDLPKPPAALYVRGDLPRGPSVAIVGTRGPTPEATRFTRKLAGDLAVAGVAILSGGAQGIDTAAHRGALSARGVTAVIAPAGYEAPYPEANTALFRRIVAANGAYVSLVPDAEAAHPGAFFPRNACLVALAHVVVVVQAPLRSGARNAAAWARRVGRPLMVVPSSPWIERGRGCLVELRLGARLCESARNVLQALAELGLSPVPLSRGVRRPAGRSRHGAESSLETDLAADHSDGAHVSGPLRLDPTCQKVLHAVRLGLAHPDALCARLGFSAAEVHQALLTLRLGGFLVPGPAGGFECLTQPKY